MKILAIIGTIFGAMVILFAFAVVVLGRDADGKDMRQDYWRSLEDMHKKGKK